MVLHQLPEIFIWILVMRVSRSAWLLSNWHSEVAGEVPVLEGQPAHPADQGADDVADAFDRVGADNYVRAGQAAWWYSWMTPPRRSRRRMCMWVMVARSVIGSGSGRNGLEFEMPR